MEAKDSQAIAGNAADKVARVGKVDKVNKVDRNGRVDSVSKVLKVSNDNHAQHPKHGWEVKKLGEVGTFQRGGGFLKSDYIENGYPCIHYGQIHTRLDIKTFKHLTCISEELALSKSKIAHTGDLIIAITSEDVEGSCKCTTWLGNYDIAVGGHAAIYRHTLNPTFVAYYFRGAYFQTEKTIFTHGSKVVEIKPNDIATIKIAIPPMEEQERIVAELDCLSGVIEKKRQQLKEYDALAQSIFYDMFGDPISNEKGWEVKRLGEIGEIISGSTPSTTDESNWGGDINWVTPAELNTQLFYGNTIRKITEKAAKSLILMPIGTVLLSSRAPIGKLAITTAPMCCNQGFKNIICGNEINNIFLYHYLMLTMDDIKALGRGATFKEVSKKNISDYKIYIPPVSLQEEFAEKIEAIEKQKELLKRSIKEVETLFDARMEYYFGDT